MSFGVPLGIRREFVFSVEWRVIDKRNRAKIATPVILLYIVNNTMNEILMLFFNLHGACVFVLSIYDELCVSISNVESINVKTGT